MYGIGGELDYDDDGYDDLCDDVFGCFGWCGFCGSVVVNLCLDGSGGVYGSVGCVCRC